MWFCRLHTSQGQWRSRPCGDRGYTEVSAHDCDSDYWFLRRLGRIGSELGGRDNLNGVVPYPSSPTTPPPRPHTPATATRRLILDIAQSGVTLARGTRSNFSVCLLSKLCSPFSLALSVTQVMIGGSGGRVAEARDGMPGNLSRYEGGRGSRNPPLGLPLTPISILTFLALLVWNGYSFHLHDDFFLCPFLMLLANHAAPSPRVQSQLNLSDKNRSALRKW